MIRADGVTPSTASPDPGPAPEPGVWADWRTRSGSNLCKSCASFSTDLFCPTTASPRSVKAELFFENKTKRQKWQSETAQSCLKPRKHCTQKVWGRSPELIWARNFAGLFLEFEARTIKTSCSSDDSGRPDHTYSYSWLISTAPGETRRKRRRGPIKVAQSHGSERGVWSCTQRRADAPRRGHGGHLTASGSLRKLLNPVDSILPLESIWQ